MSKALLLTVMQGKFLKGLDSGVTGVQKTFIIARRATKGTMEATLRSVHPVHQVFLKILFNESQDVFWCATKQLSRIDHV